MARVPTFGEKKELARYIEPDDRLGGSRPGIAAFMVNSGESHFSVNSTELETIDEIAEYYRRELQGDGAVVAVAVRKIAKYNSECRRLGVRLEFDRGTLLWNYFDSVAAKKPAYMHRPVRARSDRLGSPSHCGVEFVTEFDDYSASKFARRMAQGQKFHLR